MPVAVSIVIPAFNGAATLERVVAPLVPLPAGWELLVVDDGSTDGTVELAARLGVSVVPSDGRRNDAAARNTGARRSHGEILVFLDVDVETTRADLERAIERMRRGDVDCLFAIYDRGEHLASRAGRYKNFWIRHTTLRASRPLGWMNTSLALVSRRSFERIGGFSETFCHARGGGTDLDLGARIAGSGGSITADGSFQVAHHKPFSLATLWKNDARRAGGWLRCAVEHRGFGAVLRHPSLANVNARFSCGVLAIACAATAAPLAFWFPPALWAAAAALLLATGLNADFLLAAARERIRGWPLFVCILWIDQLACAAGLAWGLAQLLATGRRRVSVRPTEGVERHPV